MTADVLHAEYQSLRTELDAAYAAAEWDSARIDGIADRMAPIERALAAQGASPVTQSASPDAG